MQEGSMGGTRSSSTWAGGIQPARSDFRLRFQTRLACQPLRVIHRAQTVAHLVSSPSGSA
jgi:hypothetical protein